MKDISKDFNLAFQRIHCNECYEERQKLEASIKRLETHDPRSGQLAEEAEAEEAEVEEGASEPRRSRRRT